MKTKEEDRQAIEDAALKLFFQLDDLERAGQVSHDLARGFQVCARLIEVMTLQGPLRSDL